MFWLIKVCTFSQIKETKAFFYWRRHFSWHLLVKDSSKIWPFFLFWYFMDEPWIFDGAKELRYLLERHMNEIYFSSIELTVFLTFSAFLSSLISSNDNTFWQKCILAYYKLGENSLECFRQLNIESESELGKAIDLRLFPSKYNHLFFLTFLN